MSKKKKTKVKAKRKVTKRRVAKKKPALKRLDPRQKFRDALKRAWDACPGNDFVFSCQTFYNGRGYLTEKQMAALARVTPNRSYNDDEYEGDDFVFGDDFNSCPNGMW